MIRVRGILMNCGGHSKGGFGGNGRGRRMPEKEDEMGKEGMSLVDDKIERSSDAMGRD